MISSATHPGNGCDRRGRLGPDTRATRVRGMVSGRASAIGLPSAPASRSKLPRWRWRMLSATRSRPPTGAAICSRSAGNWPKPGRGIVHDPSRTVRSLPYLPQPGQIDEPDAVDPLRDDAAFLHQFVKLRHTNIDNRASALWPHPRSRRSAGRSIVAPENSPTPISHRLAHASRSGSYSAVIMRAGGAHMPASRAQPASAQIAPSQP